MHTLTNKTRSGLVAPVLTVVAILAALLALPATVHGQTDIRTEADQVITVSRGSTAILTQTDSITRISIADPEVAEPVVIPPSQILINAKRPGSTSLIIWGQDGVARLYTVEVTADIATLQRQIDDLFPSAGLTVTSTGTSLVLSGQVRDAQVVRKATELAETVGIPIVNNIQAPSPEQILLHVEFAEVSKSAVKEMGADLLRVLNPQNLDNLDSNSDYDISSVSEGIVTLLVSGDDTELDGVLRALRQSGEFKSLAQPNLVTREGRAATFLAGGEFPFPVLQGGAGNNAVTVVWKEYGIRLNFLPTITNSGAIRLEVSPEVSSLDFANGLELGGFSIPSILARRVETDVELRPGQTLAIGGLMDNTLIADVEKFPILGDIPILNYFFKSESLRQNRTELLVLVTPYILDSNALPAPPLPTGDPDGWDWMGNIRDWIEERPNPVRLGDPQLTTTPSARDSGGNDR